MKAHPCEMPFKLAKQKARSFSRLLNPSGAFPGWQYSFDVVIGSSKYGFTLPFCKLYSRTALAKDLKVCRAMLRRHIAEKSL